MTMLKIAIAVAFTFIANIALAAEQTCTFNGIQSSVPETVGSKDLSIRLRYSAGARSSYMMSKADTQMEITSALNDLQEIALYSAKSDEHVQTLHCSEFQGIQECQVNGEKKGFKVPGSVDVEGVKVDVSISGKGSRLVKLNVPSGIAVHATTGWTNSQKILAKSDGNVIRINCPAYVDDRR